MIEPLIVLLTVFFIMPALTIAGFIVAAKYILRGHTRN
jgi:Na+-transporting NADH:ubiquinone oxidoreductase subunit NqrB